MVCGCSVVRVVLLLFLCVSVAPLFCAVVLYRRFVRRVSSQVVMFGFFLGVFICALFVCVTSERCRGSEPVVKRNSKQKQRGWWRESSSVCDTKRRGRNKRSAQSQGCAKTMLVVWRCRSMQIVLMQTEGATEVKYHNSSKDRWGRTSCTCNRWIRRRDGSGCDFLKATVLCHTTAHSSHTAHFYICFGAALNLSTFVIMCAKVRLKNSLAKRSE